MTAGMTGSQCTAHLSELSAPLCKSYLRCSHISRTCVFSSPSNLLFTGLPSPPIRQKQPKIKWHIFKVPVLFSNRKQRLSFYCFESCFFLIWKIANKRTNLIKSLTVRRVSQSEFLVALVTDWCATHGKEKGCTSTEVLSCKKKQPFHYIKYN